MVQQSFVARDVDRDSYEIIIPRANNNIVNKTENNIYFIRRIIISAQATNNIHKLNAIPSSENRSKEKIEDDHETCNSRCIAQ